MSETKRASVTNKQVAEDLGISDSMVSLIRSGHRHPSVALIRRIESLYQWKATSQLKVFGGPAYGKLFEQSLERYYGDLRVLSDPQETP